MNKNYRHLGASILVIKIFCAINQRAYRDLLELSANCLNGATTTWHGRQRQQKTRRYTLFATHWNGKFPLSDDMLKHDLLNCCMSHKEVSFVTFINPMLFSLFCLSFLHIKHRWEQRKNDKSVEWFPGYDR